MPFDPLSMMSVTAYVLLTLIAFASAPKRDRADPTSFALVAGGTVLAYFAWSPWVFLAGWCVSSLPVALSPRYGAGPRVIQLASALAVAAGFAAPAPVGFLWLVLAVVLRKGLFPFHSWIPRAFERGSLPVLGLLLNGHLGGYLMLRFAIPMFPEAARQHLTLLGVFAIATAVLGAILALVAQSPRRILALLCASQAAFILAGLENRNEEGITGALVHWWVVAFTMTTLLAVYRALEARSPAAAQPGGFRGFGYHAPRFAVFFAVAAGALVGLPGTLGFAAEDLLFHGALDSHPLLGLGLPLATALNAITALRTLASLFFGRPGSQVAAIPDALPRERWALTLPVALLIAGGIFPSLPIALRTPLALEIAGVLGAR